MGSTTLEVGDRVIYDIDPLLWTVTTVPFLSSTISCPYEDLDDQVYFTPWDFEFMGRKSLSVTVGTEIFGSFSPFRHLSVL